MKKLLFVCSLFAMLAIGCERNGDINKEGTDPGTDPHSEDAAFELPESNADAVEYADLHDPLADVGQFYVPENNMKPTKYLEIVYTDYSGRRDPDREGVNNGLQNFLLLQSVAGLINRACEDGKIDFCAWVQQGGIGYDTERKAFDPEGKLQGSTYIGRINAVNLTTKTYESGPYSQVRSLFDGYVLTDLKNNPESGNVAAVASHVYNSIIVDVRDEAIFKQAGYIKKCDCTKMTLRDAFNQFKDKCHNDALVLMPVKCGELRDYVIKNKLFIVNVNKAWSDPSQGQNLDVLDDVLDWLKPNSQVLGWEQGISEEVFVNRVCQHGHMMLAADWSYNHNFTSRNYKERQPATLAKVINPRSINYGLKKNFYTPFLTDGDNYQFIITDNFIDNYYNLSSAIYTKTAFEIGLQSLIQFCPTRFQYIIEKQPSAHCTIMETFGGGYYYVDTYSTAGTSAAHRAENLRIIARRTAAHMRQHGIKVLHVMARDLHSSATKEALQAFVDANDQLEGITAVQYDPYTGGNGDIIWLTNKQGYDIPCITTKYMVWSGFTTPASVAQTMVGNEKAPSFSTVCIHAWSEFENAKSSNVAAKVKAELPSDFQAVSMQELIWRVRMHYRKQQVMKYLATIK